MTKKETYYRIANLAKYFGVSSERIRSKLRENRINLKAGGNTLVHAKHLDLLNDAFSRDRTNKERADKGMRSKKNPKNYVIPPKGFVELKPVLKDKKPEPASKGKHNNQSPSINIKTHPRDEKIEITTEQAKGKRAKNKPNNPKDENIKISLYKKKSFESSLARFDLSRFKLKTLGYLSNISDENQHIILVEERRIQERAQDKILRSFIFVVMVKKKCFVVWESIDNPTATHIFEDNSKQDTKGMANRIEQHIKSEAKSKRRILHDPDSGIPDLLGYKDTINHTRRSGFGGWRIRLDSIINENP